jgi:hypothetical protein
VRWSDEVFVNLLAGVLLGLEPARHTAPAGPSFLRLRIAVLGFDFGRPRLGRRRAVGASILRNARPPALFANGKPKRGKLTFELGALGQSRLRVRLFDLGKCLALLFEGLAGKLGKDGTHCKLTCHLDSLSMARSRMLPLLLRKPLRGRQHR